MLSCQHACATQFSFATFEHRPGLPRHVARAAAKPRMEAAGSAVRSRLDGCQRCASRGETRGDPGLGAQEPARGGVFWGAGAVLGVWPAEHSQQSGEHRAHCGGGHAAFPPHDHDASVLRSPEALVHVRWSADCGALLYVFTPPPTFLMPSLCDAPRHAPQNYPMLRDCSMLWDCIGALAIFSCFSDSCLIRSPFPFL